MDRLSKMTNQVKKTNIDALLVSIDTYINNLIKTENSKNLQMKLYILELLKFNFQKEIYLLDLPASTIRNFEYSCDNNEKISLEID
jgi:K+-transporting ATPase A subunit